MTPKSAEKARKEYQTEMQKSKKQRMEVSSQNIEDDSHSLKKLDFDKKSTEQRS